MGRHLPFFFVWRNDMVAEQEELESESPIIDCPVLVTERLVLRPPHADDEAELAELANNHRIASMLGRMPHPYDETDARAFIAASRNRDRPGCSLRHHPVRHGSLCRLRRPVWQRARTGAGLLDRRASLGT